MRETTFTDDDLAAIREAQFRHPRERVRRLMEVLWLKAKGLPHDEVVRLTGQSRPTVQRLLRRFRDGGLAAVYEDRYAKPASELDGHVGLLRAHFAKEPPRSAREARDAVERLTGLRRGLTQVRAFLKKNSACGG